MIRIVSCRSCQLRNHRLFLSLGHLLFMLRDYDSSIALLSDAVNLFLLSLQMDQLLGDLSDLLIPVVIFLKFSVGLQFFRIFNRD